MSTKESLKADAENDKLGESREGTEKCPVCGEWSIDTKDGECKNEDCPNEDCN